MGNVFAYTVLALWPLIAIVLYKNLNTVSATFCTILWGLLLLPVRVNFDFPLIPPLDKQSISVIIAFIYIRLLKSRRVRLLPVGTAEKLFFLTIVLVPFLTVQGNTESFVRPNGKFIPGLTTYDGFSSALSIFIEMLPFLIGCYIVKSYKDQVQVFKLLIIAGLIYTIPMLAEIRLSPQLHVWIYGFFPHQFAQQMRSGGFRPVVFMGHGLLVSMFIMVVIGCCFSFWRAKVREFSFPILVAGFYLIVVLVLSKGLGATIFALLFASLVAFLSSRQLLRVAMIFSIIFLLYPLLVIQDLFPHEYLVELAQGIDEKRAQSLDFRFTQEENLIARALEKPFFGWGSWGRNMLSKSITDGFWVIKFGQYGFVGFGAIALLFLTVIWKSAKTANFTSNQQERILLACHTLLVSIIVLDQLPNYSMHALSWFLVGALAGRCYGIRQEARDQASAAKEVETEEKNPADRAISKY